MTDGPTLARLLRMANPDAPDMAGKPLALRVAYHAAEHGMDAARSWLEGYWYATGTRNHGDVVAIRDAIGSGDRLVLPRLRNGTSRTEVAITAYADGLAAELDRGST